MSSDRSDASGWLPARGDKVVATSRFVVAEEGALVSFYLQAEDGLWAFVQYSRDHVWLDQCGVWRVTDGQQPLSLGRAVCPPQPTVRISASVSRALVDAAKAQF